MNKEIELIFNLLTYALKLTRFGAWGWGDSLAYCQLLSIPNQTSKMPLSWSLMRLTASETCVSQFLPVWAN